MSVFIEMEPEDESPPTYQPSRFKPVKVFAVLFAICAILVIWLARPPQDVVATPDSLVSNFERVAFGNAAELRAWRVPLRIALRVEGVEEFRPVVLEAAALFTSMTSLEAFVLPAGAESYNVLIHMVSPREYPLVAARFGASVSSADYLAEHALCYTASTQGVQDARQQRAAVAIPTDLAHSEIPTCIWHEMFHVFGFQSHPDPRFFSVLREARRPTKNDLVLLRTLHDPRLGEGARQEVVDRARALLRDPDSRR